MEKVTDFATDLFQDIKHYEVRAILRDEIVHPLRKHHFVRADRVLRFREKLEGATTNEEIDPEVLLNVLMTQTLNAEPFLKVVVNTSAF